MDSTIVSLRYLIYLFVISITDFYPRGHKSEFRMNFTFLKENNGLVSWVQEIQTGVRGYEQVKVCEKVEFLFVQNERKSYFFLFYVKDMCGGAAVCIVTEGKRYVFDMI